MYHYSLENNNFDKCLLYDNITIGRGRGEFLLSLIGWRNEGEEEIMLDREFDIPLITLPENFWSTRKRLSVNNIFSHYIDVLAIAIGYWFHVGLGNLKSGFIELAYIISLLVI